MKVSPVEELFTTFNETAVLLQEELSCTYLEALTETGENIFHQSILQEELSELAVKRLEKRYESLKLTKFSPEEIRKSFQLAILKGMKENVQPHHQMTPDSIGMLIGYLVAKFVKQTNFRILDPAVGTGNLLTTVLNQQGDKEIQSIGIEIDDLLIKLSYINANLQEHAIEFFNQDSLSNLFIDPVEVVVSDLPVGYYPDDIRALDYQLKADEGHSYAHHLFIEQSVKYVKDGGYLFFLVPSNLFESDQAGKLHEFIKDHVHIQALLQLPMSLFKNKQTAKSILVLQNKGENVRAPKEVLLAMLPSLSNAAQMEQALEKIDRWIRENKN